MCHKVDKRISEIIKKKQRQRVAKQIEMEKRAANGDMKKYKGDDLGPAVPQPTLPSISLDDDDLAMRAKRKAQKAGLDTQMEYESYEVYNAPTLAYERGYSPYGDRGDGYDRSGNSSREGPELMGVAALSA